MVSLGERDDHALDVEQRTMISVSRSRRPESARCSSSGRRVAWVRVDEADEVDAVLRVLEELARRELADVAGADDDRVLEVERSCAAPIVRASPRADVTKIDREEPEDDEPRHVRARDVPRATMRRRTPTRRA